MLPSLPLVYIATLLLVGVALAVAYARRQDRAEAVTILLVALPVSAAVAFNTPTWSADFRDNLRLGDRAALVRAPPVVQTDRNLALAEHALAAIAPDETFAIVSGQQEFPRKSAAARNERARLTYVSSWLQYWLAPRLRVDRDDADWLLLIDAGPPPTDALTAFRFGDDLLVRAR